MVLYCLSTWSYGRFIASFCHTVCDETRGIMSAHSFGNMATVFFLSTFKMYSESNRIVPILQNFVMATHLYLLIEFAVLMST